MATNPLVTLDTDGILTDPAKISSRLLYYFFKSDYEQSNTFRGMVKSLQHIIARNPNNIQNIKDDIESDLTKMFSAHFDDVKVLVSHNAIKDASGKETARVNINVAISFSHNGELKQVATLLEVLDKDFLVIEGDWANAYR